MAQEGGILEGLFNPQNRSTLYSSKYTFKKYPLNILFGRVKLLNIIILMRCIFDFSSSRCSCPYVFGTSGSLIENVRVWIIRLFIEDFKF